MECQHRKSVLLGRIVSDVDEGSYAAIAAAIVARETEYGDVMAMKFPGPLARPHFADRQLAELNMQVRR